MSFAPIVCIAHEKIFMRFMFLILLFLLGPSLWAQNNPMPAYGTRPVDFDAVQTSTDSPAALLQPLELDYPETAVKARLEGVVLVAGWIDAKGYVRYAEVVEGSGFAMLDSAALKAAVDGNFRPAQRGGKPVASRVNMPVEFRLRRMEEDFDAAKTPEQLQQEKGELRRAKEMLEAEQRKLEEELRLLREQQNKKK